MSRNIKRSICKNTEHNSYVGPIMYRSGCTEMVPHYVQSLYRSLTLICAELAIDMNRSSLVLKYRSGPTWLLKWSYTKLALPRFTVCIYTVSQKTIPLLF